MSEYPYGDLELRELALGTTTVPRWRLRTEKAAVWVGMVVGTVLGLVIIISALDSVAYGANPYGLLFSVLSALLLYPTLTSVSRARRVHHRIYVELPGERPGPVGTALEASFRSSFLDFRKEWTDHPGLPLPAVGLWTYRVEGYKPTVLVIDIGHGTLLCIGPVGSATAEEASRLAYGISRAILRTHGPVAGLPAKRHVWPRRP